jgi:hypothetical protein
MRAAEAQSSGDDDLVIGGALNRTGPVSTEELIEAAAVVGGFALACMCIFCGAPLLAVGFIALICVAEKAKRAKENKAFMGGTSVAINSQAIQMRSNPAAAGKVVVNGTVVGAEV